MRRRKYTGIGGAPALPQGRSPGVPAPDEPPDQTALILSYLRSAHGKTRSDSKGDHYYDNVSAVSLHFLLKTGLPAREILWQWYLHFDRDRSETIYQTLPPLRDEELLQILERCDFRWNPQTVRESGLVFLKHHRDLVYLMLEDFLSERLEAFRTMDDEELRQALTPRQTWSDQHLARLIQQIQTQPLSPEQRRNVYDQFETGYLKATARHLMDQATTEAFWKNPPPELEEFEASLIAFARRMTAEARRLGVYVSKTAFDRLSGRQAWEGAFRQAAGGGRAADRAAARQMIRESHFATLGLSPSSSLHEVKTAYREMVKQHHPDQGGTVQDFLRLQEAYEYLLTEVF